MLSKAAANALLKTLEEPPPGLMFILATTEPEKLPATIVSRCQHFRFRRLSEPEIASKLVRLCAEAGIQASEQALNLVSRSADGAMRDAESLLERLLAMGEQISIEAATVTGDITNLLNSIVCIESNKKITHQGISPHVWVENISITGEA